MSGLVLVALAASALGCATREPMVPQSAPAMVKPEQSSRPPSGGCEDPGARDLFEWARIAFPVTWDQHDVGAEVVLSAKLASATAPSTFLKRTGFYPIHH